MVLHALRDNIPVLKRPSAEITRSVLQLPDLFARPTRARKFPHASHITYPRYATHIPLPPTALTIRLNAFMHASKCNDLGCGWHAGHWKMSVDFNAAATSAHIYPYSHIDGRK